MLAFEPVPGFVAEQRQLPGDCRLEQQQAQPDGPEGPMEPQRLHAALTSRRLHCRGRDRNATMNAQPRVDVTKPGAILTDGGRAALSRAMAQVNTLVLGKPREVDLAFACL